MRNRTADNRRLLVATEVAWNDLSAAVATEALDQRADIVGRQGRRVVTDRHCLRDGVRLRVADPYMPEQVLLEPCRAAGAKQAPGFKDPAGHGPTVKSMRIPCW